MVIETRQILEEFQLKNVLATSATGAVFHAEDPQTEYDQLREEVGSYSEQLAKASHCVVLTKMDLVPPDSSPPEVVAPGAWGVFPISSVTRMGLDSLLEGLHSRAHKDRAEEESGEGEEWWVPE